LRWQAPGKSHSIEISQVKNLKNKPPTIKEMDKMFEDALTTRSSKKKSITISNRSIGFSGSIPNTPRVFRVKNTMTKVKINSTKEK
jgi:hypothetical protein